MQGLDDELCEKIQDEVHNSNGSTSGLGEDMEGYDEEMTHISSGIFVLKRVINLPKICPRMANGYRIFQGCIFKSINHSIGY